MGSVLRPLTIVPAEAYRDMASRAERDARWRYRRMVAWRVVRFLAVAIGLVAFSLALLYACWALVQPFHLEPP